jgi:uncharacterized membrane protein YkoI
MPLPVHTILALVVSSFAHAGVAAADTLRLTDRVVTTGNGHAARTIEVEDHERIHSLKEAGKILSLESLIETIRRENPGRIIEIELDDDDGRYVYELELVDEQGIVWDLEVDARTGERLKKEQDD